VRRRQQREHIDQVIERVQEHLDNNAIVTTGQVVLDIRDVERLINASIWGDD